MVKIYKKAVLNHSNTELVRYLVFTVFFSMISMDVVPKRYTLFSATYEIFVKVIFPPIEIMTQHRSHILVMPILKSVCVCVCERERERETQNSFPSFLKLRME